MLSEATLNGKIKKFTPGSEEMANPLTEAHAPGVNAKVYCLSFVLETISRLIAF